MLSSLSETKWKDEETRHFSKRMTTDKKVRCRFCNATGLALHFLRCEKPGIDTVRNWRWDVLCAVDSCCEYKEIPACFNALRNLARIVCSEAVEQYGTGFLHVITNVTRLCSFERRYRGIPPLLCFFFSRIKDEEVWIFFEWDPDCFMIIVQWDLFPSVDWYRKHIIYTIHYENSRQSSK